MNHKTHLKTTASKDADSPTPPKMKIDMVIQSHLEWIWETYRSLMTRPFPFIGRPIISWMFPPFWVGFPWINGGADCFCTSMFKVCTMGECLRVMLFFQCHFQVLFCLACFFRQKKTFYNYIWWFQLDPSKNICSSNWIIISPQMGVRIQHIWTHHLPGTLWWPLFSMEFGPSFGGFKTSNPKIYDKHKVGPYNTTYKNEVITPINGITNR